jgi:hypothetical protein
MRRLLLLIEINRALFAIVCEQIPLKLYLLFAFHYYFQRHFTHTKPTIAVCHLPNRDSVSGRYGI